MRSGVGGTVSEADVALRVIVADDDADIRDLVSIAVVKAGLDLIDQQHDGESAWWSIQENSPDIALLDVSMPGMTGLEVCRLVRADDRFNRMRVLLLSASVSDEARQIGIEAGANQYLIKPFSPRELAEHLCSVANGMKARL